MTYILGLYIQVGLIEPSKNVIRGALWGWSGLLPKGPKDSSEPNER